MVVLGVLKGIPNVVVPVLPFVVNAVVAVLAGGGLLLATGVVGMAVLLGPVVDSFYTGK